MGDVYWIAKPHYRKGRMYPAGSIVEMPDETERDGVVIDGPAKSWVLLDREALPAGTTVHRLPSVRSSCGRGHSGLPADHGGFRRALPPSE